MFVPRRPSLVIALLASSCLMSCGQKNAKDTISSLSPRELTDRTLSFAAETRLLGDTSSSISSAPVGLFHLQAFNPQAYKPGTILYVPVQAASYLQQSYGPSSSFRFQSFSFVSSDCNATNALNRYFSALETLSGGELKTADKERIEQSFTGIFAAGASGDLCLIYDILSCFADFSRLNTDTVKESAQKGDISVLFTGALSCVSEVLGSSVEISASSSTASP